MLHIKTGLVAGFVLWLFATTPFVGNARAADAHATDTKSVTAVQALDRLKEGNERYARHKASHPDQSTERMMGLAAGQHPFAVILSCSDSRVPPELVFDQGLGDLFVVRVAGNTLDDAILGTIEYAVEHLGSPLVVVMGHEKCGAVQAAMSDHEESGHIPSITRPIAPLAAEAKKMPGDPIHNAVLLNTRNVAGQLRQSEPFLKNRVAAGTLQIVAAVYDLASGRVTFVKEAD